MFKGALIENQKYYNLRGKQLIYIIPSSIAIGFLVNFYQMPIWGTIGVLLFYVASLVLTVRNQQAMSKIVTKTIEIDPNHINIRDQSGNLLDTVIINSDTTIRVKQNYKLVHETMSEIKEELQGNSEKHFIEICNDGDERRFYFEINSHFMLNQLIKIIRRWEDNEYTFEYV